MRFPSKGSQWKEGKNSKKLINLVVHARLQNTNYSVNISRRKLYPINRTAQLISTNWLSKGDKATKRHHPYLSLAQGALTNEGLSLKNDLDTIRATTALANELETSQFWFFSLVTTVRFDSANATNLVLAALARTKQEKEREIKKWPPEISWLDG